MCDGDPTGDIDDYYFVVIDFRGGSEEIMRVEVTLPEEESAVYQRSGAKRTVSNLRDTTEEDLALFQELQEKQKRN